MQRLKIALPCAGSPAIFLPPSMTSSAMGAAKAPVTPASKSAIAPNRPKEVLIKSPRGVPERPLFDPVDNNIRHIAVSINFDD